MTQHFPLNLKIAATSQRRLFNVSRFLRFRSTLYSAELATQKTQDLLRSNLTTATLHSMVSLNALADPDIFSGGHIMWWI